LDAVIVQAAEEVPVSLFAVDLAWVVELQLLHRIFDGSDLYQQKRLEVGMLVAFLLAFYNALFDSEIFLPVIMLA
jgi:hypothetical protein